MGRTKGDQTPFPPVALCPGSEANQKPCAWTHTLSSEGPHLLWASVSSSVKGLAPLTSQGYRENKMT